MPIILGTETLTLPDGTEVDVQIGLGLSITAVRPPSAPAPVAPTVTAAAVNVGTTPRVTITFSEECGSGHTGFTLADPSGTYPPIVLTYNLGDGGLTKRFNLDPYPYSGQTLHLSYVAGNVADLDSIPLANFSAFVVTNSSDKTRPAVLAATLNADGTFTLDFDIGVTAGAALTGLTLTHPGGTSVCTYVSAGFNAMQFSITNPPASGDTVTCDYVASTTLANTIRKLTDGHVPLTAFAGMSVTNNLP